MNVRRKKRALETMAPSEVGRVRYVRPPAPRASKDVAFEAILSPNRSLPPTGFVVVMGIVISVNVILGVYFTTIGAWPVLGFCGLDIFLVWLAFKVSYRQGRLHERIRLTEDELLISRVLPSGHESRWRLQPYWTNVSIADPDEHEAEVRVTQKGRTLVLGSFLSPPERVEFAKSFKAALLAARTVTTPT